MGNRPPTAFYPFHNDYDTIRNNGVRYPVPDKGEITDWYEWMKLELISKEICSNEILQKTGKLSPLFSKDDGKVAMFGPERKKYEYLHAIKNEDGHNYLYRVWLQFLYDEMVLGNRSPRVLRLASFGEEYERTHTKWNELSDELSKSLSEAMDKYEQGHVLKDILILSDPSSNKVTISLYEDDEPSLIEVIARKSIQALISNSQEKNFSEWPIYQRMRRQEINDWFDKKKAKDESAKGSDFKNKNSLIKNLIDEGIKPPNFNKLKRRTRRCFPNPVFINKMVNCINSELKKAIDKIFQLATEETGLQEFIDTNIYRIFDENSPEFGHRNKDGNLGKWKGETLEWRIRKASENMTHEILRILTCELKWITLEKGDYEDLESHYNEGNNEKIIRKMKVGNKIPNMIYLTEILNTKIPAGAGPERKTSNVYKEEIHGDEIHSIFRFMTRSTKRWTYCEPVDHHPKSRGGLINPGSRLSILGAEKPDRLSPLNIRFNKEEWNAKWPRRTKIGSEVCEALNRLQKTQWEVNFQFLDAVTDGYKIIHDEVEYHAGHNMFILKDFIENILVFNEESTIGLPEFRVKEIQEEIKTRKKEISDILASCHKAIRNGDNVFWHPWACDYRGRFNTVSKILSPQGSDFSKAIIRFKEWKPLGDEGWKWFKVHVCNLMSGIDFQKYFCDSKTELTWDKPLRQSKESFASRAEWTERHLDSIIHISENLEEKGILQLLEFNLEGLLKPKNELFQRLSVILEFTRIVKSYQKKRDWNEVYSGMPVHLDASCNGFQHAAALLQNRNLAKKVNLIKPNDQDSRAEDLYTEVAEYASKEFKERRSKLWKYLDENKQSLGINDVQIIEMAEIFNRNLVKRPTLMIGYGASDVEECIISGKDDAAPPQDKFKESDWSHMYGFREKDAKESYDKMNLRKPDKIGISYKKMGKSKQKKADQDTLHIWIKKHLPNEDISQYNTKEKARKILIENRINPPDKHFCFSQYCKEPFNSMKELKKHVKKHKIRVWHPESPLYKSVNDEIKTKINNRIWPSEMQIDFAKNLGKDIEKSIEYVTNGSFTKIGKKRLLKIQALLRHTRNIRLLESEIKELKEEERKNWDNTAISKKLDQITELKKERYLLAWTVLDDNGITITNYTTKKGDGRHLITYHQDARRNKKLVAAYELIHKKKLTLNEIFDDEGLSKTDKRRFASLARTLLAQLISKEVAGELGDKLDVAKQLIDDMFNIAYHLEADLDKNIKINRTDYTKGILPNFVHSLDAAHMRNVINSMAKEGIDSFWSVHDSFGTHAADIGKMREIINKEFIELHKGRNINWWCEQMYPKWESSDDDWDWEKLDLDEVEESEFLVG